MSFRLRVLLALSCALAAVTLTIGLVAAFGSPMWQADGVALVDDDDNQRGPQIVSDGAGGAIVTWYDYRDFMVDIYARRVDQDGNALWGTDGVKLCGANSGQWYPQITSDGSGGAIVTWQDQRYSGTNGADIYARRVDGNGNALWYTDGVTICEASNAQEYPQIISDGSGGAIVTWTDLRDDGGDIYAQRVYSDGTVAWASDGVSLRIANGIQNDPQIVSDGSGGAIVTWEDLRFGSDWEIYAQRVDSNGNTLWVTDGVSLSVADDDQMNPRIAPDGYWGAIVTWEDYRSTDNWDIYAQRVGGVPNDVNLPLVTKNYQ